MFTTQQVAAGMPGSKLCVKFCESWRREKGQRKRFSLVAVQSLAGAVVQRQPDSQDERRGIYEQKSQKKVSDSIELLHGPCVLCELEVLFQVRNPTEREKEMSAKKGQ